MSVAKHIEIRSGSDESFEDAVEQGIKKMAGTISHIEGAWIRSKKSS
jgi:flavin-binding protein dodecin